MTLIDRQHLVRPYCGSRRMAAWLATQGHAVNRKRVRRPMRLAGLWRSTSGRTPASRQRPTRSTLTGWAGSRSSGSTSLVRRRHPGSLPGQALHPDGHGLPLPGGDHGLGAVPCWRGGCPTRSARSSRSSVSKLSRKRPRGTAGPISSTPSRRRGQPVHQRRLRRRPGAPAPEPGLIARRARPTERNVGDSGRSASPTGQAFAHIPTGTTASHRVDVDEEEGGRDVMTVAPAAIGAGNEIGPATPYTNRPKG